MGKTMRIGN